MQGSTGSELSIDTSRLLGWITLGTANGINCGGGPPPAVGCYVSGTAIDTVNGPVLVENLKQGDKLITFDGEEVALKWVGHRALNCSKYDNRLQLLPIKIKAGAIKQGVPNKDLYVSPDHALYLDGALVPAFKLLNGGTIIQVNEDEVTYFHLECERHVILIANGAAAESYLEVGNRAFFSNTEGATTLHPSLPELHPRHRLAAPWSSREKVAEIRRHLLARAEELGYRKVYGSEGAALLRPQKRA